MTENRYEILLVDDERNLSALTQEFLESKNWHVGLCHSADEALQALSRKAYDLCVLDVRMPVKDGFALAADIRLIYPQMPIIFLTGQTDKEQRIKGFVAGADDYMTKPFSMEELSLRIQAVLRRVRVQAAQRASRTLWPVGQYQFDPHARILRMGARTEKLSATEAALLQMFCESPDGRIEREAALRRIWSDDHLLHGRSLNVYISKLRRLLKDDPNIEILNVHGSGYRMITERAE